jgi:RNA polymerase sigma-70 factor, ECF subfamily
MMATMPTDSDLARMMRDGDKNAFAELYHRRQRDVYRFTLHMTGTADIAEDVTQEVFMVLMRCNNGFDEKKGSVNSFLLGVARNLVLRRFRQERFFVPIDDSSADTASDDGAAHDALNRSESVLAMHRAVLALPAHYREAVVLCDLQELSYTEAAAVLGCAIGTVRSRLHRARTMLIERMGVCREDSAANKEVESARCFA